MYPFNISIKQDRGSRDYLIAQLELQDDTETPLCAEAAVGICHQCIPRMAEQLRRAHGLVWSLRFIEPGSNGVELGVDLGDGLARLLTRKPGSIMAVDHWKAWETAGFADSRQSEMDRRYEFVVKRYASDVVNVVREPTQDWLAGEDAHTYDWVVVDANHRYPQCRDDMLGALRILKPGGYMIIDDAHEITWREQVQRGIADLIRDHGAELEEVWMDSDPVVLRKVGL